MHLSEAAAQGELGLLFDSYPLQRHKRYFDGTQAAGSQWAESFAMTQLALEACQGFGVLAVAHHPARFGANGNGGRLAHTPLSVMRAVLAPCPVCSPLALARHARQHYTFLLNTIPEEHERLDRGIIWHHYKRQLIFQDPQGPLPTLKRLSMAAQVQEEGMTKQKIILDTDIGTDVDDAWALATVLGSPELDLLGVTTVYGDTALRASIARTLLILAGRADIPVACGQERPLPGAPAVYWPGHEGRGLLRFDGSDPQDFHPLPASDFIIEMSHRYAGELLLVAIAPLTNVAMALRRDPSLVRWLQGVVLMGGGGGNGATAPSITFAPIRRQQS
jgi:hypothetical protein